MHDPWQLYLDNEAGDSTKAREALEAAWNVASKMHESRDAFRVMARVMEQHADAGAVDSEGWQELDRRMRRIWPDWD